MVNKPKETEGGKKKPDSFLSSLLGKMESTNKIRASAPAMPKNVENILTVVDRKTRELLDEMMVDSSKNEVQMEVMDKDKRRLVHNIVGNDYPAFVSCRYIRKHPAIQLFHSQLIFS